jgi:Ca2+-binding RTX toxin-like protein
MSDYAAIVDCASSTHGIIPVGEKPYWSTDSGDGKICFVSVSGNDRISPISYASGREVARIAVGDHPQRMRIGTIHTDFLTRARPGLTSSGRAPPDARSPAPPARPASGHAGRDVTCAGPGNDVVRGAGGDDWVDGGGGKDVLRGGPGADRVVGGDGRERLVGGDGRDELAGDRGRDVHSGQAVSDELDTGDSRSGNDVGGRDFCFTDRGDQRTSC